MSLTKVSYSMIAGASANVLDFGASGDGVTDNSVAFQSAVDSGATTIYVPTPDVSYIVNTPVKVPSGVSIVGANFSTGLIGPYVEVAPAIKKTTNTTALVETWVGGAPSGLFVARDCVFYCDPAYFAAGSGGSVSGYYPQNFGFIGLSISGPGASGSNAAIFCEFGSGLVIQNVDAVGFTHGFWGREPFSSTISKLRTDGRITISGGGTSMLLNQCAANNGYWLTNLLYSTFNACTSDGGSNSAYNITDCSGVVFNSCGAESKTSTATVGAMFNFNGGNYGCVVNGGLIAAMAGSVAPSISIGNGDNIIVTGWRGDVGSGAAPSSFDLYVNGTAASTNIKFIDCYFKNFSKSSPSIQWAGAGATAVVDFVASRKIYTSTATQSMVPSSNGTWVPQLYFAIPNTLPTQTGNVGNWWQDDSFYYYTAYIVLTAIGTGTGSVYVNGLPFTPSISGIGKFGIVTVGTQANMTSALSSSGYISNAGTNVELFLAATPSVNATNTAFTATSQLRIFVMIPKV